MPGRSAEPPGIIRPVARALVRSSCRSAVVMVSVPHAQKFKGGPSLRSGFRQEAPASLTPPNRLKFGAQRHDIMARLTNPPGEVLTMKHGLLGILLSLCLFAGSSLGQSSKCTLSDHTEYGKKIREYTTEPFFITELVDHLPYSSCVPAPDAFLHHIIGAPDVLDYTKDINAYMRLLAAKSPRVKVFSIGASEEGREMLAVVVSDETNLAKLERYKEITRRLADPRGLSDGEAQKLIAEGKPIYWADGSIHSPETGAPEMLMELAYRLAVEETPFIQKIRKDSIVMITPVVEVDGHDRMVDIYLHRKQHPNDPPYSLIWSGHYVAHDNNRDSLGMNLALSRNMLKNFLEWHPTVLHDLHESVPYLYIMTGTGPYNAWLDPIAISEGQQMAYYGIEDGTKRGVLR